MRSSLVRLYLRTCKQSENICNNLKNNSIRTISKSKNFRYCHIAAPVLPAFAVVHAWGFGSSKKEPEKNAQPELSADALLIKQADDLYSQNDILTLYDLLLAHKDSKNDDILWRLARAACDKGKMAAKEEEKKALMFEAFEHVKKALDLNDKNFAAHKWYAILLDYTGEFEGTKARISKAYHVKEHLLKAIELNPSDATSIHSLGYWCFLFADMPWYQRKIAGVVFTTPPSSTYEEALKYFQQAEEVDPNFYSMNLLLLGKTYLRLNDKKSAMLYLTKARDFPVVTEDDKKARKEALELLSGL